jgi:glycosyl transferase family 2
VSALIVIPVFDEALTIGAVVSEARRHATVLVVDDGSRDGSADIARGAGAEVLRHARRAGKGAALRSAMEAARRRGVAVVVTLDGDGQHAPGDVPRLLEAARRQPGAIVIGSRLHEAERIPLERLHAMRVATFFLSWATGLPPIDTQSGFRAYPLARLRTIAPRRGGFVWETEILVRAMAEGVAVVEVPITVIPHAPRPSRFSSLGDGVAVAAYLAPLVLARWRREAGVAAREIARLFDRDRRQARHAEMLAAAMSAPAWLWGPVLTRVAARRAGGRLRAWWQHPRRRRAAVALAGTLAAPAVLGALALPGAGLARAAGPLVRRLYDADRLRPDPRGSTPGVPVTTALPPAATVSR